MSHASWVQQTKLQIPRLRPGTVPRPDLYDRLAAGAHHRLTLISAPAGFGKSTLLSQWLATQATPVAWLSLEPADNSPSRFWSYICDGLAPYLPEAAAAVKGALQALELPAPELLLRPLLDGLAALPERLCLILDDYHLIEDPAIHEALTFLIDHLVPSLHLILISRGDPPLPLARWRARAELAEIRAQDLRFTLPEATAFLNQARNLGLEEALVGALFQRTEGWVTGLQLAALSLRDRRDSASFVAAFAGSHRYVLDYLVEEVLERQSAPVQQFLLQTSVLQRLNGSLCEAVTGMAESRQLLHDLEEADLFLLPLDAERHWFRYHHLFAEMLRAHLQLAMPERLAELHLRASDWFAAEGITAEAIEHALAAQAWERAADLIEGGLESEWADGAVRTLLTWLKALPEPVLQSRPRLCLLYARTLIPTGKVEQIDLLVNSAARGGAGPGLAGEVSAMRCQLARLRGDLNGALALARQALTELLPTARGWRGLTEIAMGGCHRLAGELTEAMQAYSRAAADCAAAGNSFLTLTALNLQAEVLEQQGRLRRGLAAFQAAGRAGSRLLPASGWALVGEGGILAEQDRLAEAVELLTQGVERGKSGHLINVVVPGYLHLVRVRMAQGDLAEAERVLTLAMQEAHASGLDRAVARVLPWRVRLSIAQGDLNGAYTAADTMPVGPSAAVHALTLARVLLADGRPERAFGLLTGATETLRERGEGALLLEALILGALCLHELGQTGVALATLREVLDLAVPEGYRRLFLDEGAPLQALLAQLPPPLVPPQLVGEWRPVAQHASATLVEPLSERELEVLRLIDAGATNQAIGDRLFVSVNTVKKHTTNIFGKLGVNNRTHALARARELRLL